ncbi:Protein ALP1-like protein, partial [Cucurbita argyrosperma subsp. argyrosperma]|uniref:Protein ALP1-like n=1 Tax=Cucurbita moschata TaxID=3662 RepID=A0A6J1F642_CUCMO
MEISSFPFLNQDDLLPIFNLFSEMDDNFSVNQSPKKRRRQNDDDDDHQTQFNKTSFDDDELLKLPFWFDDDKQQHWIMEQKPEFQVSDENLTQFVPKKPRRATPENTHSSPAKGGAGTQHRRLWVKDRSKDWWDQCNHPDFPDEEFRRAFRMSKATFDMICQELDSTVMKKDTMLRVAIPVRQRVAVCIWRLATGEPLRLVSKRFGLGISTCHKLVLEVCSAIRKVLMPKFLQWPEESKLAKIKQEFESISGIPKVGGSIYTTHIPIIAPKNNVAAYFNKRHTERNQKTSYSITVQGVVDPAGVFTDVCIGWPGSMPDDQVLEKSALFERANMGLLKDVSIVGNSGYPLTDWLLVPYSAQNLTWTQHAFNEKVSEIQGAAKAAFGRLKGRWTCLQKRTEVKLQELPVVLGACCVLHNICEMRKERFDPELKFEFFDDEMVPENNGVRSASAIQARDHIAHNLLHHGLAGTGFL